MKWSYCISNELFLYLIIFFKKRAEEKLVAGGSKGGHLRKRVNL